MWFIHVTLTVHLVTCEHSLAHLYCGKITFFSFLHLWNVINIHTITFQLHLNTNLNILLLSPLVACLSSTFLSSVPGQFSLLFCQMKGRLYLSTVPTMDVVTRPHALTNGLPLRLKTLTAQTPQEKLLTGTIAHLLNLRNKSKLPFAIGTSR